MVYLVFNTLELANTANATISSNMGLTGNITTQWAEPQQRQTDSKYVFRKPDDKYMTGVTATEEEYSDTWFPVPEI